ncbi:MAG: hypothetical protein ACK4RK_09140 [Gemmataceae bacterium]
MRSAPRCRMALTLLELVVVLVILVALAALVVPMVSYLSNDSRDVVTRSSMNSLRDVIVNRYWPDMNGVMAGADGYPRPNPNDLGGRQNHPQLVFLFSPPSGVANYDPIYRRGWNGPYLQHSGGQYLVVGSFTATFGLNGDPTVLDGWGHPIVLQQPTVGNAAEQSLYTRLISAGPDGVIQTPANQLAPARSSCGDDLVLYLRIADPRSN